jgi:hypothetical protein
MGKQLTRGKQREMDQLNWTDSNLLLAVRTTNWLLWKLRAMINLDNPHLQFLIARLSRSFLAQSLQNVTRYAPGLIPYLNPLSGTTRNAKREHELRMDNKCISTRKVHKTGNPKETPNRLPYENHTMRLKMNSPIREVAGQIRTRVDRMFAKRLR